MIRLPIIAERIEVEDEYLQAKQNEPPKLWLFAWDVVISQGKRKELTRRKRRIVELDAPTWDELGEKLVNFFEQPNVVILSKGETNGERDCKKQGSEEGGTDTGGEPSMAEEVGDGGTPSSRQVPSAL